MNIVLCCVVSCFVLYSILSYYIQLILLYALLFSLAYTEFGTMTRVYILAFVMSNYFMFAVNAVQVAQLQPKEKDAYSNDINKCFFNTWNSYTKGVGVTNNVMNCELEPNRVGLCYGLLSSGKWIPSFAVCYDKTTLIPVFTGHIVSPHGAVNNENREFRNEAGDYGKLRIKLL